jgi:hypothetical protein
MMTMYLMNVMESDGTERVRMHACDGVFVEGN